MKKLNLHALSIYRNRNETDLITNIFS